MTYYAVLDTNVIVSALLKNGSVPCCGENGENHAENQITDSVLSKKQNIDKTLEYYMRKCYH